MNITEKPGLGHNEPPEPTPFEQAREKIENLFLEAKNWCDGRPIVTKEQADEVGRLVNLIRGAHKQADEARKAEVKPFDEGKSEVQARYAPLIADTKSVKGKTVLALEACKKALAPWLDKLDREKRAAAQKAQEEAEAKQREAQEAMRAAQAAEDLEAREKAEDLVQEAKRADQTAKRAAKDTAKVSGGAGRAVGLTSVWTPVLTDAVAAARWYWGCRREEIRGLLIELAERDIRAGKREIPGFTIEEKRVAR